MFEEKLVEAGPTRAEVMTRDTAELVIAVLLSSCF